MTTINDIPVREITHPRHLAHRLWPLDEVELLDQPYFLANLTSEVLDGAPCVHSPECAHLASVSSSRLLPIANHDALAIFSMEQTLRRHGLARFDFCTCVRSVGLAVSA
jgi:hypothetical protein